MVELIIFYFSSAFLPGDWELYLLLGQMVEWPPWACNKVSFRGEPIADMPFGVWEEPPTSTERTYKLHVLAGT